MVPLSESHVQQLNAAGWTEAEVQQFLDDIDQFRGTLGEKQRAVLDRSLELASDAVTGDEVSGFLVVPAIIAVIIGGPLVPSYPNDPPVRLPPLPPIQRPAAQ